MGASAVGSGFPGSFPTVLGGWVHRLGWSAMDDSPYVPNRPVVNQPAI